MVSHFYFEEVEYAISADEDGEVIRLPDGRLLNIGLWHETYPSKPGRLTVIEEADVAGRKVLDATVAEQ